MSRQLSPHVLRMHEVLKDGHWHERESVMREMEKAITPGEAVRAAEQTRTLAGGPPERTRPRSMEFLIASGKRSIARSALSGKNRVERMQDCGQTFVRLRPPQVRASKPLPPAAAAGTSRVAIRPNSPRVLTKHLARAFELLADGAWHDRAEVLAEMFPLIDEQAAVNMTEYRRTWKYHRQGLEPPPRSRPKTWEQQVQAGRRSIAAEALQNSARIQHRVVDGRAQVLLRPPLPSGAAARRPPASGS